MTCLEVCSRWWVDRGEIVIKELIDKGVKPTNYLLATICINEVGSHGFAPDSFKKNITKIRAGEYNPSGVINRVNSLESVLSNRDQAVKAFTVREPMKDLDTDPLGVLDIKKAMFDVPETYAKYNAPLKLDGYGVKMGIISDIHFPIHDRPAVLAAHAKLRDEQIDCLLLLGDIMDTGNLSRHSFRQSLGYTWREELEVTRAYIRSLRVLFPNIPIVYQQGNHESWLQQFLVKQAPQLEDDYLLQDRLQLAEHDIEWVDEYRLMTYGELYLHHGHMLGVGGGRHVASRILDKHGVNFMVGHYHRQMSDEKMNVITGKRHAVWINGCLADPHPKYNPFGNSTHGCSLVHLNGDGTFRVEQFKILNGKVLL